MSEAKLGFLISETSERDAIHVAIAPVVAAENLDPGDHVGLNPEGKATTNSDKKLGIVDPFLTKYLQPGDRFYLVLYPNTVTGMRHHWFHPAFKLADVPQDISESVAFIQHVAKSAGIEYVELMMAADDFVKHGTYLCEGGRWEGFGVGDEFWDHYEKVVGKKVDEDDRGAIFTCSC